MTMHKLINTPAELDEAVKTANEAGDNLVLRDRQGRTWDFGPAHLRHAPGQGWGAFVEPYAFPFLVLWWPGSIVIPKQAADS